MVVYKQLDLQILYINIIWDQHNDPLYRGDTAKTHHHVKGKHTWTMSGPFGFKGCSCRCAPKRNWMLPQPNKYHYP